jgi:hypothetical protein
LERINIEKTVVKVEIDTFWIAILTPTAGDGLRQLLTNNNKLENRRKKKKHNRV